MVYIDGKKILFSPIVNITKKEITADVHDVIDVTELPTSDIDTSKYYRMNTTSLYRRELLDLTGSRWHFNKYSDMTYDSTWSESYILIYFEWNCYKIDSLSGNRLMIIPPTSEIDLKNTVKFINVPEGTSVIDWKLTCFANSEGVEGWGNDYRYVKLEDNTVTNNDDYYFIEVGNSVNNTAPSLVNWLMQNATYESGGTWGWQEYLNPLGTLEISENGTTDVTEYASVEVNVQPKLQVLEKNITENGQYNYSVDEGYDAFNGERAEITVSVPQTVAPTPIEISTESEMTSALDTATVGQLYKYTGTTGTYEQNAIYIVEEE